MASWNLHRRDVLRLMGVGMGTLALGRTGALAATPVGFQLSWLPSVQFGGSYIAKDKGYWSAEGLDVSLASGGPNAATYMWYSDIATATICTAARKAALVGVVACASSETTAV